MVHVVDILEEGNLAAGNSIQNVANLLKPALLIPLLIVSRRAEPAGEMLPPRSIGGGCRLSEPLG